MIKQDILVVDDTVNNLELLEIVLDDAGYDVRTATSGEMALKSVASQKPDLILLDIMMPGIDGYETCRLIKEDNELAEIPIIFLSAKSEVEDKVKGFEVGAVDYLLKPFETIEVLARIKTHLSMYKLKMDLNRSIEIMDRYVISSITDAKGIITDVSLAMCKISGYTKEELIGKSHNILRHEDMHNDVFKNLWKTILSGKTWKGEIKNLKKNGDVYWVYTIITANKDLNENIVGFTSVRTDVTDKKMIEVISITDQLTGLYNRRHFNELFKLEIKNAIRQASTFSFFMLDIDYFKQYNDTYGHQMGDEALKNIASELKRTLNRYNDFVFRLGGEEFGIIISTDKCEDSLRIAQSICKAISDLKIEHSTSKVSNFVSISIGIVCLDYTNKENYTYSHDDLYRMADDELYRAKDDGRNRVSLKKY